MHPSFECTLSLLHTKQCCCWEPWGNIYCTETSVVWVPTVKFSQ
jgi:hypothetical protein